MVDHKNYMTIMVFLFSEKDCCNQFSPVFLPALIGARIIKNDFRCYAETVSALPRYDTTNFKNLLSTVVIAMDNFMNREDIPSADMEVMINVVKTLMGDS